MVNSRNWNTNLPETPHEFEELCLDLWKRIWNDPNAGFADDQLQYGVDIYGRKNGDGLFHAIQCKHGYRQYGLPLSTKQLFQEVKKLKESELPLDSLILATTVPVYAATRKAAERLSADHRDRGLFSVEVFDWSDIQSQIVKYPDLLEKYFPGREAELVNALGDESLGDSRRQFQYDIEADFQPRLTIRKFILQLLTDSGRPLSISEIAVHFADAGYTAPRSSIRGRLNTLTNQRQILRVGRGVYASIDYPVGEPKQLELKDDLLPEIPEQEDGLAFEISVNGKIGYASSGLVSGDDDVKQVGAMREVLLQALDDLLGATEGSNAFASVRRIVKEYRASLEGEIDAVSIDRLYAQGLRLDNANDRLKAEIAKGDLPDTGLVVGEALDSVLAIHGPTILSTRRGQQLLERSRRYNVSRDEELVYKEKALIFAKAVAESQELVEPEVRDSIESLNAEIGEGRFPERSSDLARRANQNLLSTIAKAAVWSVGTLATHSFLTSAPGLEISSIGTQFINAVYSFLQVNNRDLRLLAAIAGQDLSWLTAFLDWWERRKIR